MPKLHEIGANACVDGITALLDYREEASLYRGMFRFLDGATTLCDIYCEDDAFTDAVEGVAYINGDSLISNVLENGDIDSIVAYSFIPALGTGTPLFSATVGQVGDETDIEVTSTTVYEDEEISIDSFSITYTPEPL